MSEQRSSTAGAGAARERYTLMITIPENPVYDDKGRWQPERVTALEGWKEITWWMRIVYIGFVVYLIAYNIRALILLPENMLIGAWFGLSAFQVPTVLYMAVSLGVVLYLIYRDLIRRSISRYRLFIPLAALVLNSCLIGACFPS